MSKSGAIDLQAVSDTPNKDSQVEIINIYQILQMNCTIVVIALKFRIWAYVSHCRRSLHNCSNLQTRVKYMSIHKKWLYLKSRSLHLFFEFSKADLQLWIVSLVSVSKQIKNEYLSTSVLFQRYIAFHIFRPSSLSEFVYLYECGALVSPPTALHLFSTISSSAV